MTGPIYQGGNWQTEVNKLRKMGTSLPNSPTMARAQAKAMYDAVDNNTLVDVFRRRRAVADGNRQRLGSYRTGSNMQIALPKIRQPLSSLADKGIPFDVEDEEELKSIRSWCRLFYSTHDLVPLLIDIYSKFPVVGMEMDSKDPLIKKFYEDMFLGDDLNYLEFLPDQFGREYFTVGEVTSLAHFNESLGVWSSEEILNPDMLRISRSLFVQRDRVQLMVKDLVDTLRQGPMAEGSGLSPTDETPSERLQRTREFQELQKFYPEIIQAAAQNDGLDISEALISRVVNRPSPWAKRGAPHLLRSFRTLMMEESLNAAQDAVCVPAGTPVLTSSGVRYIEDISTDDEVLTHRGRYRRVVRPMARQADELGVTIRWWYDQPLTLTGEHPIYARRKAVQRGVCAVCGVHLGGRRTVCNEHLASRKELSGRLQRAACCLCGSKANAPKSNHCDLHDPNNQPWLEGFVPAHEVRVYDQVLHPFSPDSGKEYVSVWEHLDQSDWVAYDPSDSAFGMTGHDWYDGGSYQMRLKARQRVESVLAGIEASPGDIIRHNRFRAKTQHFGAEYKLTEDLLWLIGLHVADGSAQINNSSGAPHGSVVITLGTHEVELQRRTVRIIRETFGIEPTVHPVWGGKKAVNVTVNSLPLATWFREMCGVKDDKRFPSWAFGLTSSQTASLIEGWMDGDGTTDEVRTLGSSAYRHLQESAAWLMRRTGITTSSRRGMRRGGFTGSGCQYTVTSVKTPRRAYPSDDGGYWAEVRSVEHHQVTDTVYNLEVEEDNSYCAPIAVHNCDRLYSPLILATLGVEDMGDGEPWIPDQSELDDTRDDMQNALAADFRLMVHNFGLKVENVFGRESVPNLDADYDRVERKLLQAWGIGEALISGGTGGAYASSALNREFVTQIMTGFQNSLKRHIKKRAEVIAEAQGHYDYDLKGGRRMPLYREVVEVDPETGKEYIRKVPKLLIPDIKFSTLNLRDEAQERAFISQLKAMGVPISDKTLAVNIDVEFDQELERQADESVSKLMATAQAMKKVQDLCDAQNLPYPPELAQHLMSTLQLRQGKTQTELGEAQAVAGEAEAELQAQQMEMQETMMDQQMAGGAMPGQPIMAPGAAGPPPGGPPPGPPPGGAGGPGDMQAPAQGPNVSPLSAQGPGAPGPGNPPAGVYANSRFTVGKKDVADEDSKVHSFFAGLDANGPQATGPAGSPPKGFVGPELPPGIPEPTEVPRNRQRPMESDEQQGTGPKAVGASKRKRTRKGEPVPRQISKFERGPSSYGKADSATEEQVESQVRRLETVANWDFNGPGRHPKVSDLVMDPNFYRATNMQTYQGQLQADWPEILNGGATDSKQVLDDMLAQFFEIFGVEPTW